MNDYWKDFPNLKHPLNETCLLIEQQINIRNKDIEQALLRLVRSGGKLLRPAFFFLFSQLGERKQQDQQQLIQIAASIEILHMATLVHDDIIDDSPLRRGQSTIQATYGKDIAVYTGDLLFTKFFDLLATSMNGSDFLKINATTMKRLLLGELDQMHTRYNKEMTIRDYLRSVTGKTAELFSLSCLEGAHFGHATSDVQLLAPRIGRRIGIAFQIFDDILDYTTDTQTFKKPILEDLSQGIYTLPLLLARNEAPQEFDAYLDKKELISLEETQQVQQLVKKYQGVTTAQKFAETLTHKALADIDKLPDCIAKEHLTALTKLLLQRSY